MRESVGQTGGRSVVRGKRRGVRRTAPRQRWYWLALVAVVVIAGATLLLARQASDPLNGRVVAQRTSQEFGQVPINGGLLRASFPLTVEGETLVTALTST